MQHQRNRRGMRIMFLLMLVSGTLLGTAWGKKQPKTYPEEGKIVATAVGQSTFSGTHTVSGPTGTQVIPTTGVRSTRIYTIQTDSRIFELDCGKTPHMFSSTPGECGGDKKLQIGDVVHFRVDKGWGYIPIVETDKESGQKRDGEEKMRVLKEELKP